MSPIELIFGILLLIISVVLVVAVLMQTGKDKGLSSSIGGGAETFFGKSGAKSKDKILNTVTIVAAVLFALIVIVTYIVA